MNAIKATIQGGAQIDAALKELEAKTAKSYVRKALRAGAKPILQAARANAPVDKGITKKSIKVRSGGTRRGIISVIIGLGKKWFAGPVWYGSFQEFGFHIGSRKKSVRRKVPGKHFIEHAYDTQKEAATDAMMGSLREQLQAGIKQIGQTTGRAR
jgi:HK97 gp10 family phage protein